MAFETKVLLNLLADGIGKSKSLKEAYNVVEKAANVEGVNLPTYDEYIAEQEKLRQENS
ncbi:MAG: hypothetical protein FWF80_06715 [Defluviitaleaceae bacterium]|nr:hypothetical protein [Defluviitaleaceae bacterium]